MFEKYRSPITLALQHEPPRLMYDGDKVILQGVCRFLPNVDLDELQKTLMYDRDQYRKGYEDGKHEPPAHATWIGGELGRCSVCGHKGCASDIWSGVVGYGYCPNCGALMDGGEDDDD